MRTFARALVRAWRFLELAAVVLVLALSPSSYTLVHRRRMWLCIHAQTVPVLPWFALLAALLSLVLIQIVIVTARSYGLSHYALAMVIRVLLVELIPLSAALFVALYAAAKSPGEAALAARQDGPAQRRAWSVPLLQAVLLPQLVARVFAVLALACVSGAVVLVLAYLLVYGPSPWGLPAFTHTVGQIFTPSLGMGLALKLGVFSVATACVPLVVQWADRAAQPLRATPSQSGLTYLFAVLFVTEAVFLTIQYV